MFIARLLLNILMIAFIVWAIRRVMRRRRQMKDFQPKTPQRDRAPFPEKSQESIDLVRDEKTGEYRVKDK